MALLRSRAADFVAGLGGTEVSCRDVPRRTRCYEFRKPAESVLRVLRRELEGSGWDAVTDVRRPDGSALVLFTKGETGEAIQFASGAEMSTSHSAGVTSEVAVDTLL